MRRFSLRDLFWLVLVVGVSMAWWLEHRRAEHYRRAARYFGIELPSPESQLVPEEDIFGDSR